MFKYLVVDEFGAKFTVIADSFSQVIDHLDSLEKFNIFADYSLTLIFADYSLTLLGDA